jgi:hypothetical protein
MALEIHPVMVRIGDTMHLAAQAINSVTGARGPLLSAEACNLDASKQDQVNASTEGSRACLNCNRPVLGSDGD